MQFMCALVQSTKYSVLMSGSRGYSNYRHQADVLHLSKMLHESRERYDNDSQIITLAYDDIAYNHNNPNKGKIYNDFTYENVYNKSIIDYSGDDVNYDTFEQIILNLPLTLQDILFIYYNDHGAPGLLCIPKNRNPNAKEMYADDIAKVLSKVYDKVGKIVVIIESCYSGSVAQYISHIPNLIVISAASAIESSYSTKWDKRMGTSLSNLFTSEFLKYISHNNSNTLKDMFNYVSKTVHLSNVNALGNLNILNVPIRDIFGILRPIKFSDVDSKVINSHNSLEYYLKHHMNLANNHHDKQFYLRKYGKELKKRSIIKKILEPFEVISLDSDFRINDFKCYKTLINVYKRHCSSIDETETTYLLPSLAQICETYDRQDIEESIKRSCH